ncbi:MAG: voltage-gated sodium channel [Cognaticolwellia sp.]|jgi:voltage-gated sodium channel
MLKRFFLKERNMMIAIAINAIVIFCLGFPSLSRNILWIILDDIFIVFFLVEAIVKVRTLKFKKYWKNNWNRFDFIIAVLSLPLLFPFVSKQIELQGIDPFFILMLRLFRLFRLVRFFWFVPNLAHLLRGLTRAFKASIFVLIILVFMNFVLSILTTHFYGQLAPDLFGNPLKSFYTIFQLFTLEGWNEIPKTIEQATDSSITIFLTRVYFAFIVLLGGIFGMSLANAIFVDEMTLDNNEVIEEQLNRMENQIKELKDLINNNRD